MARSVDEINVYMVNALVTNFATIGITINPTLWSKRNMLRLFIYSVAIGQALLEQLQDAFMVAVEAQVAIAAAASDLWIQSKMFQFQYSDTSPQYVSLINGVPQYATVDTTLNVITACSVTSSTPGIVTIKVAQTVNGLLAALTTLMTQAAQGYINTIGTAGIIYNISSLNPDQIYIAATIWFQGQYSSTIQATVIAAITNWLQMQSITNFNGNIKMSDLEGMIRTIPGVDDVELNNVSARPDSISFGSGIQLVVNNAIIQRQYASTAGYVIPEQTAGQTLVQSLTLIAD